MEHSITVGAEVEITYAGTRTKLRVLELQGDTVIGEIRLLGFKTRVTLSRAEVEGRPPPPALHTSGTRTTPPSNVDLTGMPSVLARRARATRLHPRIGQAALDASKLGGRFLWPADEPWPRCTAPEWPQYHLDPDYRDRNVHPGEPRPPDHALHNDHHVPILQLRRDELSSFEFPGDADLFQLLWCPRDHGPDHEPVCAVYWRRIADVHARLAAPPAPARPDSSLVPVACYLNPEDVDEYEAYEALSDAARAELAALGDDARRRYSASASTAPGTKLGGGVRWIETPQVPTCRCGRQMQHLLTVDSNEFSLGEGLRWCPVEDWPLDQRGDENRVGDLRGLMNPTGLCIGDAGALSLFICRACPEWPVASVVQSG